MTLDPSEASTEPDPGPWTYDAIAHLIDFGGDAPWHGAEKPDPIDPGANPGSLVAAVIDAERRERARWALTRTNPLAGIDDAAEHLKDHPDARLVIFDGDTGQPVVSMKAP